MKIHSVNARTITLQREIVTCDWCDGTGKREQGISCPLTHRSVRGLRGKGGKNNHCPHCDTANRHRHTSIGEEIVDCWNCKGTCKQLESISFMSADTAKVSEYLNFYFGTEPRNKMRDTMQTMFGIGTFVSCTDYGRFFDFVRNKVDRDSVKTYEELYALPFISAQSTGNDADIYKYIVTDCLKHASINDLIVDKKAYNENEEVPFEIHREIMMRIDPNGYRFIGKKREPIAAQLAAV